MLLLAPFEASSDGGGVRGVEHDREFREPREPINVVVIESAATRLPAGSRPITLARFGSSDNNLPGVCAAPRRSSTSSDISELVEI